MARQLVGSIYVHPETISNTHHAFLNEWQLDSSLKLSTGSFLRSYRHYLTQCEADTDSDDSVSSGFLTRTNLEESQTGSKSRQSHEESNSAHKSAPPPLLSRDPRSASREPSPDSENDQPASRPSETRKNPDNDRSSSTSIKGGSQASILKSPGKPSQSKKRKKSTSPQSLPNHPNPKKAKHPTARKSTAPPVKRQSFVQDSQTWEVSMPRCTLVRYSSFQIIHRYRHLQSFIQYIFQK